MRSNYMFVIDDPSIPVIREVDTVHASRLVSEEEFIMAKFDVREKVEQELGVYVMEHALKRIEDLANIERIPVNKFLLGLPIFEEEIEEFGWKGYLLNRKITATVHIYREHSQFQIREEERYL